MAAQAVTELTNHHEHDRAERWHVSDAPDEFIDAQLKAIVGIEVLVDRVEAKAKSARTGPSRTDSAWSTGLRRILTRRNRDGSRHAQCRPVDTLTSRARIEDIGTGSRIRRRGGPPR